MRLTTYDATQLVFVDESAANERTLDRKYGWAPKGLPAINLDFLTNKESGIFPLVVSTFYLVILSLVISIPIGVATNIRWMAP